MELKRLSDKNKQIFKVLLFINFIIVFSLAAWYFYAYIINQFEDTFFRQYVFLPLFIALLGTLIMLMSLLANSSSFKSNSSADKTMFIIGIALEFLAILAIFGEILIHRIG